jgi:tetratricopeptide (TPR) repeat protein
MNWTCRIALAGLLAVMNSPTVSWAQEDPEPVVEEVTPLTDEEKVALFQPYVDAIARGQKSHAANALLPILGETANQSAHGEAWVKLGDLLAEFDMEYSALIAYDRAIDADPNTGSVKVTPAIALARKLGDERLLGPVLAANVGLNVDKNTRSDIAYLAARHYFQDGQEGMALGMLRMVNNQADVFPDAQALNGVILTTQGRFNDALAPLVTAQQMGRNNGRSKRFENVLQLNVARSYFAAGNYLRAIEYYANVDRESDFWPEAHFERAWAHFRQGDVKGTVAVLMSHEAPFFDDWYLPEGDLLRTYALFMLCKFPDANKSISAFMDKYTPLKDQLVASVDSLTPQAAWDEARAYLDGSKTQFPAKLLRKFSTDERFLSAVKSVEKADDELSRLQNVSANPFATMATARLQERRSELINAEGLRVFNHIRTARDQLVEMLSNVEITKLDIMTYETRMLEKASMTGTLDYGDRIGQLRRLRKKKGVRVWPFQGEYWGDEMGYYQIQTRPDCPEGLQAGSNN